jgi:hypothetical protein
MIPWLLSEITVVMVGGERLKAAVVRWMVSRIGGDEFLYHAQRTSAGDQLIVKVEPYQKFFETLALGASLDRGGASIGGHKPMFLIPR